MNDPFVGSLTFCRIYSGTLDKGTRPELGEGQEGARRPHAADARQQPRGHQGSLAGDIVALAGLKETTTGDTLCDPNSRSSSSDGIPGAGHRDRGRAEDQGRPGKDGRRAQSPAAEDPSFRVSTDHESARRSSRAWASFTSTSSRPHAREFKVEANVGAPQVAYRETSARRSTSTTPTRSSRAVRASSPASSSKFEPGERVRASCSRTRSSRRQRCRRNISRASKRASEVGQGQRQLAGFPVIDFKVALIDGAYHDVDSSACWRSKSRARRASRRKLQKAGIKLLEPIMKVEVVTPGRLHGRRHRRPEQPSRPDPGHRQPRQRQTVITRWCRWPTCSAT
jgi:elongation factor G